AFIRHCRSAGGDLPRTHLALFYFKSFLLQNTCIALKLNHLHSHAKSFPGQQWTADNSLWRLFKTTCTLVSLSMAAVSSSSVRYLPSGSRTCDIWSVMEIR